jgi:hypothetical protein
MVRSKRIACWDYEIESLDYKGFLSRTICNIKSSIVDVFGVG